MNISPVRAISRIVGAVRTAALPVGILAVGWTLSSSLYIWMEQDSAQFDQAHRDDLISSIESTIRGRLAIYENVLNAAAGDLTLSAHLSNRNHWSDFVRHAGLFRRYPGAEVMSIIQPVNEADLPRFLAEQRKEGPQDFSMRSPFGASSYSDQFVVIAAEPPEVAARALGADLGGDPVRRRAAESARDSGAMVLTGNVRLGKGPGKSLQLFVPVYRAGMPTERVEQRRAALFCWVSAVFATDTFLRSTMAGHEDSLDLQIFDGEAVSANLLFSSNPSPSAQRGFERTTKLDLAGASWTLGWNRTPNFPAISRTPAASAGVLGGAATLLIVAVIGLLQWVARQTETKLAMEHQRAEESQAFLASLVQSSDDSIVGTTLDGIIKSWNRGSVQLWGYSAEEAIGQHITILFPPERRGDYLRQIRRIEQNEAIEPFESIRVTKDGRQIDVSAIVSAIRDSGGRLLGLSAMYTDITVRKRAEEELRRAKEAAEAANRAKSQFLANMSHEIRTPMNGILGMTEAALDTPLDPEQREYLTTAKASAEVLLSVVNDILDYSKIEAGRLDLDCTEFHVRETVAESIKLLALSARQKGLDLRCSVDESVPETLQGDPLRIRQVLVNLLGNAIKFTSKGQVSLTVEGTPVEDGQCSVCFVVQDTGIGISSEKQELIFSPFTQADGSITRKFGGTGLGLTICRRLVEMMGGRIWVESEMHHGSTFFFAVPLGVVESLPVAVSAA